MGNKLKLCFFVIILFSIFVAVAYSQDRQNDFSGKIEKIKLSKLLIKLDMDSATTEVFKDKYKDYSRTVKELTKQRVQHYKGMVRNLDSGDSLDIYLDRIIKTESEIDDNKIEFLNDLRTILTSKQIATMIIFERKFNNQVKKLMQDLQKDKKNKSNRRKKDND